GSSRFGAEHAALLGLPYAFASHFAPASRLDAVATYRDRFEPSKQLNAPYVIAGVNVLAAETDEAAQAYLQTVRRARVSIILGRVRSYTDEEADAILSSAQGHFVEQIMRYTAVGTPDQVQPHFADFAKEAGSDELMVVHAAPTI